MTSSPLQAPFICTRGMTMMTLTEWGRYPGHPAYKYTERAPCSQAAGPSPALTGRLRAKDPPHTWMVHLALTQPRPCPSPDTPPASPTQYSSQPVFCCHQHFFLWRQGETLTLEGGQQKVEVQTPELRGLG